MHKKTVTHRLSRKKTLPSNFNIHFIHLQEFNSGAAINQLRQILLKLFKN